MGARLNTDILDELADALRDAFNDQTDYDIQVEPRMVLNPTPPTVDMWPGDESRDGQSAAFGDEGGEFYTIRARVQTADSVAGQNLLLALMDDEGGLSVRGILFTDTGLGGLADDLDVVAQTGYVVDVAPSGEGAWLACRWTVLVLPARS